MSDCCRSKSKKARNVGGLGITLKQVVLDDTIVAVLLGISLSV